MSFISSASGGGTRDLPDLNLPAGSAEALEEEGALLLVRLRADAVAEPNGFLRRESESGSVVGARSLGGTSPIPGRGGDTFGVAAFYYGVSDDLTDSLRGILRGREYGGELFYNVAGTPWLRVTADLQVISPALREHGTAVIFGLRAQIRLQSRIPRSTLGSWHSWWRLSVTVGRTQSHWVTGSEQRRRRARRADPYDGG